MAEQTPQERLAEIRRLVNSAGAKRSPKQAKRVTIAGVEIEIRPCTLSKRQSILRAAGVTAANPKETNFSLAHATALMELAYVPGTDLRIYEGKTDLDGIMSAESGSEVEEATNVAGAMLNVSKLPAPEVWAEAVDAYLSALDGENADAREAALTALREVAKQGKDSKTTSNG